MIFAANYTSFALDICKARNTWTISGIMDAFRLLPEYLKTGRTLGAFMTDLALGWVFSLIASFRLIESAFTRET